MDTEKLLKMADFVETLPEENFDLSIWKQVNLCGTVCCAVGWAIEKKLFPELSFRHVYCSNYPVPRILPENTRYELLGFDAVSEVFNISWTEAKWLFSSRSYLQTRVTPKMVSERIRTFVKENSNGR